MAIEHRITAVDTVHHIAYKYFGSPDEYMRIVEFNGLDYPYIVQNASDTERFHARGFVKVTRPQFTNDLTILKGSTFQTAITNLTSVRSYEVIEDTTLAAGAQYGYVFVRCTFAGVSGNCLANDITRIGTLYTPNGLYTGELSITNESPFQNGFDANVRYVGQVIMIPSEEDPEQYIIERDDFQTRLQIIGGEDLLFVTEGAVEFDRFGDLASVSGLDNIKQSVVDRLLTEKGDLPLHPEYGTDLEWIIQKGYNQHTMKLVEIAIQEAMQADDTIEKTTIKDLQLANTKIGLVLNIDLEFKVVDTDTTNEISITRLFT